MQFGIKLLISLVIIVACSQIARSRPELAGLISVMPLTGLLVMLWVYHDCGGDAIRMGRYTLGLIWGIVPVVAFFVVAYLCFRRNMHLGLVLSLSFAAWLAGAFLHQYLFKTS